MGIIIMTRDMQICVVFVGHSPLNIFTQSAVGCRRPSGLQKMNNLCHISPTCPFLRKYCPGLIPVLISPVLLKTMKTE